MNAARVRVAVVAMRPVERDALAAAARQAGAETAGVRIEVADAALVRYEPMPEQVAERRDFGEFGCPVVAVCDTPADAIDAIRRGADGVLLGDEDVIRLREVLAGVVRGRTVFPLAEKWAVYGRTEPAGISVLERRVLAELATGAADVQIAERLRVSRSLVRRTVAGMRKRFGARHRLELLIRAHALGLDD